MKRIIVTISLLLQAAFCEAQKNNFTLVIRIDSLREGPFPIVVKMIDSLRSSKTLLVDSLTPRKNEVVVRGYVPEERQVYFNISKTGTFDCAVVPGDSVVLRLTARKFTTDYHITGSRAAVVMVDFVNKHFIPQSIQRDRQKQVMDSLMLNHAAPAVLAEAQKISDSLFNSFYAYNLKFADTTPSAVSMAYALHNYLGNDSLTGVFPAIEKAFIRFGDILPIKALKRENKFRQNLPTAFSVNDMLRYKTLFDPVTLQKVEQVIGKKKLILIDFWASWCQPCIEEFPALNKAFQQFSKKGFDIISISLDENREAWMKAQTRFPNLWQNNFWEEEGFKSEMVKVLNIKSIPRNYLIDNQGKIYAKDLRGMELLGMLRKLL